ncbi:SDR family oxidoreductase [Bacillus sp. JCM 19041]|uniref:SDR family oxidoreductase n=1 Tax=Bacillus sp. JCM 19041 TaxID=1460637 RepID=UPI000B1C5CA2
MFDAATSTCGRIDGIVCNHALSGSDGPLGELTAAMLDSHYAINTRATLLLAQAYANQHQATSPGRIIFMTSGQGLGPMSGEVAYAAAKGALQQITHTIADQLADHNITVNTVNPGPVDTGYMTEQLWQDVHARFPFGRMGENKDPARLIAWLLTEEASWITGQVIHSEGGFRR